MNQLFTLQQHFNSSDYDRIDQHNLFGNEITLGSDIMVVGGSNKTYFFSEQNEYWQEELVLVLDQPFDEYHISGHKI